MLVDKPEHARGRRELVLGHLETAPRIIRRLGRSRIGEVEAFWSPQPDFERVTARARQRRGITDFRSVGWTTINSRRTDVTKDHTGLDICGVGIGLGAANHP